MKYHSGHIGTSLASDRQNPGKGIRVCVFQLFIRISGKIPVFGAHIGKDHRICLITVEIILGFCVQRREAVYPIIRARASVSHIQQKIPVFFR